MKKTGRSVKCLLAVVAMVAATMSFSANSFAEDPVNNNEIGIGIDANNTNTATGGAANSDATGGAAAATVGNITTTNGNENNLTGVNKNNLTGINDNTNILKTEGGDSSGQTTTVGGQTTTTSQDVNVSMDTPRPFLAAPGFIGGIVPGTVENGREWKLFCPSVGAFSSEKIHRMSGGSGWFSGNDVTVTEIEESRMAVDSLTCQLVWPATFDGVGAEVIVSGDTNSTQASAVGLAMEKCVDRGFPAIAMVVVDKFEGETKGRSIGLSGAASTVADTSGVAFVGGGMLGTNKTRINDYKMVRAMCLTSLTLMKAEEKTVVAVETKKTEATQVCNPEEILAQIKELKRKIALCTQFCFNNLQLREALGEKYIDLALCMGDKKYFNLAITEGFEVAERNFKFGKDIKSRRTEATAIMRQVYFLQAGCLNQIYGIQMATDFANKHNLEKFPQRFEQ